MRKYETGATGIDLQILTLLSNGVGLKEIAEAVNLTEDEVIAIVRKYIFKNRKNDTDK